MKCDDWQLLMEEELDKELSSRDSSQLRDHLSRCSECGRYNQTLHRELSLYSRHDRGLGAPDDLWAGVQSRLRESPGESNSLVILFRQWLTVMMGGFHLSPAWATVMVLISIAGTVAVMKVLDSRSTTEVTNLAVSNRPSQSQPLTDSVRPQGLEEKGESSQGERKESPLGDARSGGTERSGRPVKQSGRDSSKKIESVPRPTVEQLVREAESKYLAAIKILSRDVQRRSSSLDPSVRARLEASIASIDRSIEETRLVVRRSPEDPVAVQYMLTAYAKKVEVLREMASF